MSPGPSLSHPSAANAYLGDFVVRVAESFRRVTGESLYALAGIDPAVPGLTAWTGRFALLCHRGDEAATLNYGNDLVLNLWACDWDMLVTMLSAATAPPDDRAERDGPTPRVARDGFVSGYSGRRLSTRGRLFLIEDVTVWRLFGQNRRQFWCRGVFQEVPAFVKTWSARPATGQPYCGPVPSPISWPRFSLCCC